MAKREHRPTALLSAKRTNAIDTNFKALLYLKTYKITAIKMHFHEYSNRRKYATATDRSKKAIAPKRPPILPSDFFKKYSTRSVSEKVKSILLPCDKSSEYLNKSYKSSAITAKINIRKTYLPKLFVYTKPSTRRKTNIGNANLPMQRII